MRLVTLPDLPKRENGVVGRCLSSHVSDSLFPAARPWGYYNFTLLLLSFRPCYAFLFRDSARIRAISSKA
jgi:hypothetical protein